jgi:hypothetical protein
MQLLAQSSPEKKVLIPPDIVCVYALNTCTAFCHFPYPGDPACATDDCANLSACRLDGSGGYTCLCADTNAGATCDTELPCTEWECQGEGTCEVHPWSGKRDCTCNEGTAGDVCDRSKYREEGVRVIVFTYTSLFEPLVYRASRGQKLIIRKRVKLVNVFHLNKTGGS